MASFAEKTLPIDPETKLPSGVLAQIEESNRLLAESSKKTGIDPDAQVNFTSEVTPEPGQTPDGEVTLQPFKSKLSQKTLQNTQNTQNAQNTLENDPEHRYNSMKGRFDAAQAQIRQQAEAMRNMEALVGEMQSKTRVLAPEQRPKSLLSQEDRETYGDDFLEVVGKKAKDATSQEIAELKARIEELAGSQSRVAQQASQSAQERMFQTLTDRLPGWREQNVDPEFLTWLDLPDPFSGAIRKTLLSQAVATNSTERVLAFFNGFLANGATTVPPTPKPEQGKSQKLSLESLAAPGRAKASASGNGQPEQKPFITANDIAGFYADVTAGRYDGRDAEKTKAEAMIFSAQREGRIR